MSNHSQNSGVLASTATAEDAPLTAEAERLRGVFETVAERELGAMTVSARAIVRAWAEAEIAIEAARRSQEPGAADLLPAEAFRIRPYLPREETSRGRIIRWCFPGRREPLDGETDARVVRHNGAWVVMHPGGTRAAMELGDRAEFERVTYLEAQDRLDVPLLIESLAVPAVIAGGNMGWEPAKHLGPADILAQLDKLEAGCVGFPTERERTVEHVLLHLVAPPQPTLSAETAQA